MATIVQIINADRNLSLFCKGIKESELDKTLNESGPFTVFGPVNLALGNLHSLSYDQLLDPANRENLLSLLGGYILPGKKMLQDFRNDQKLSMLNGREIVVTLKNDDTYMDGAKILAHDRQGTNGVVHLLDKTYAV